MIIRVVEAPLGYVHIGEMTLGEGEHDIWNGKELRRRPEFKKLIKSGQVQIVDESDAVDSSDDD